MLGIIFGIVSSAYFNRIEKSYFIKYIVRW